MFIAGHGWSLLDEHLGFIAISVKNNPRDTSITILEQSLSQNCNRASLGLTTDKGFLLKGLWVRPLSALVTSCHHLERQSFPLESEESLTENQENRGIVALNQENRGIVAPNQENQGVFIPTLIFDGRYL